MNRVINTFAPAGLLIILVVAFATLLKRPIPGRLEVYLVAGGVLILAHLLLRWEALVRAIGVRQLRYGTNMIVLTIVVLGILGVINAIAARRVVRWDLTKAGRYSLSDQTKKIVDGLKEDVHLTYFQRRGAAMEAGRDRLRSYEALSPHVKIEYVDPYVSRARAVAMDVRPPLPHLVIDKGENRERLSSDSEEDITNALIKVTRGAKKTVCFVEGEGERGIDDSGESGLSEIKKALDNNFYATEKVLLLREKSIPESCTVLVVAGPQRDLLPPAIDAIRTYVKGGGKLMALVEPEMKEAYPNLTGLLSEWNIEAGPGVVVDVSGLGSAFGLGDLAPLVADYPSYHEITRDFRDASGVPMFTVFPTVRGMKAGSESIEGLTAQDLARTSKASWAETDSPIKSTSRLDDGEQKGPISVAVAVTIRGPEGEKPEPPKEAEQAEEEGAAPKPREARIVAVGDADFAVNQFLGAPGNRDLFLNSVAWLAQDVDLISIRPKNPEDQRMFLSASQQILIVVVTLLGLPALCLLAGIIVWIRRR